MDYKAAAAQLKETLRLRTEPFGVAFFKEPPDCRTRPGSPPRFSAKK
jgi:uncharacterized protein (DUF169 family)